MTKSENSPHKVNIQFLSCDLNYRKIWKGPSGIAKIDKMLKINISIYLSSSYPLPLHWSNTKTIFIPSVTQQVFQILEIRNCIKAPAKNVRFSRDVWQSLKYHDEDSYEIFHKGGWKEKVRKPFPFWMTS